MEEKMLILKMLQEGKITTDDAVKLLEALEKGSPSTGASNSKINEIKDELTAKLNEMKLDEKLNKFGEKASKFAEALGEKAGKLAEQLGENINTERKNANAEKFTEEIARKMESLGQDIAESASKFAENFASQLGTLFETGFEKYRYNSSYTYPIQKGASVYLKSSNFSIKAAPGETQELIVNVFASSDIPQMVVDDFFKTIVDGNSYRLSSDFPGRTWGRIELQLPIGMDVLSFSTDNARCEISEMEAKQISICTTNGRSVLTSCTAEAIEILTDNEKVVLDGVASRDANIRTSNSKITICNSHIDNIDAKTSNAAINVAAYRKGSSLSSDYTLSTSNGKIEVLLGAAEGYEHMVDAHTTMGSIDVSLPNLVYEMDKKSIGMRSEAQVKSDNYNTSQNRIVIKAVTSNAPIYIGTNT